MTVKLTPRDPDKILRGHTDLEKMMLWEMLTRDLTERKKLHLCERSGDLTILSIYFNDGSSEMACDLGLPGDPDLVDDAKEVLEQASRPPCS